MRLEQPAAGRDVPQLVVRGKERRRHGGAQLRNRVLRQQPGLIAVVLFRRRHQAERVVRVPRRACVQNSPARIANVLQFLIHAADALALHGADSVLQVHNVIGEDDVGVLAGHRPACAQPQQLRRTADGGVAVRVHAPHVAAQHLHRAAVDAPGQFLHCVRRQQQLHLPQHLQHVAVRLAQEQQVLPRVHHEHHRHREG